MVTDGYWWLMMVTDGYWWLMMVNDGEWEVFLSLRGEFGRNSLKFTDHYQTWGLRPDMANL